MNARKYYPYSEISLNIEHYSQGWLACFFQETTRNDNAAFHLLNREIAFFVVFHGGFPSQGDCLLIAASMQISAQDQSEIISTFLNLITI